MITAGYSERWLLWIVAGDEDVEFAEGVGHRLAVEVDRHLAEIGIDVGDVADVAVVDLPFLVVLDLHDLVARRVGPAEAIDLLRAGGVEGPL